MFFFALLMMYAYSWGEYSARGDTVSPLWKPLWDSVNYCKYCFLLLSLSLTFPTNV